MILEHEDDNTLSITDLWGSVDVRFTMKVAETREPLKNNDRTVFPRIIGALITKKAWRHRRRLKAKV